MIKHKTILINYVAKHSYAYEIKMIEGLIWNKCTVIAVVSKNMPELNQWKKIDNLILYEVDGYQSGLDFLPKLIKYYIHDALKLKKLASDYNVDVIFDPIFTYWTYFINLSLNKYAYIYTLHDPIPHNRGISVHNYLNYKIAKKAKKIVILSETFKSYVQEKYKKEFNEVTVIPEGTNLQVKPNEKTRIIDYDDNYVNFVFQGRIDIYKGIGVLVQAYKKISNEYTNVSLTIAGSGDLSNYLKDINHLNNCTVINRWLSNQEITGLYNDKNVVAVLPYLSATQSGVVNVAMPCGAPIIASRCGAIPEQIEDGITGLLVKPGDVNDLYTKMKYMIVHKDVWNGLRFNAYKRIESLDWNILALKLINEL